MKGLCAALALMIAISGIAYAQDSEIYYSTYVILNSEVRTSLEVERQADSSIDYIRAELYFFPKDDERQSVLSVTSEPQAEPSEGKFVFSWQPPEENLLQYKVSSRVQIENKFEKVFEKISFPLKEKIPADIAEYANPTEKIDSNSREVISLANQIAEGEDDLYILIHKLAEWVEQNVEYSLTTVTQEATQKASWVLENRYGVCDEITALFMAMCRALGIPAKFVSGISYTNDPQFKDNWGPHGWAEVYMPGYGWVPFDVTYREFGWIDPSHIKLYEDVDPDRPSGKIEWKGRNFKVNAGRFDFDVKIAETGGKILDTVDITAKVHKKEAGFGSYNLAEATVKNLRNYYVTTDISLSAPQEVNVIGSQNRQVILKPGESKKLFWMLKVSSNLDKSYIYTFPVVAYNQRNTTYKTDFKASNVETVYSESEISGIMEGFQEEQEKEYSRDVSLECSAAKEEFYSYEANSAICLVENKGNTVLKGLNVCLGNDCKEVDVMIAAKEKASFSFRRNDAGKRDLIITASNADVSKTSYVPVIVLDIPNSTISALEFPESVSYNDQKSIKFTVLKESYSDLYNAKVSVVSKRIMHEWDIDVMNTTRNFMLDFMARDLAEGRNDFTIIIEYEDKKGRKYSVEEDFSIELSGLSLMQSLVVRVKGAGFWMLNWFR